MSRTRRWTMLTIALALIVGGSLAPGTWAWVAAVPSSINNLFHAPAYALFVYAVLVLAWRPGMPLSAGALCIVASVLAVVVGVLMEWGQMNVARDSSALDVGLDLAGAVIGSFVWWRTTGPMDRRSSNDTR